MQYSVSSVDDIALALSMLINRKFRTFQSLIYYEDVHDNHTPSLYETLYRFRAVSNLLWFGLSFVKFNDIPLNTPQKDYKRCLFNTFKIDLRRLHFVWNIIYIRCCYYIRGIFRALRKTWEVAIGILILKSLAFFIAFATKFCFSNKIKSGDLIKAAIKFCYDQSTCVLFAMLFNFLNRTKSSTCIRRAYSVQWQNFF